MLDNVNWNYPTSIAFGNGRVKELPQLCDNLSIKQPLIVTDSGLASFDFISNIHKSLNKASLFSEVKPNPNGENIEAGVQAYHKGNHDGVIAIGGGSALDAGKAIALMVGQTKKIWDFEDVGDNWTQVNEDGIAPIIAIPTTAGTGSEVGRASVILNEETHQKKIIFHPKMLPSNVILDPELTVGLPPTITAATGIDAFVHSYEAFCAPGFHPMADGIALQGMTLVKDWLPKAVNTGSDLEARGNMIVASTMGATAFQKGLGGVHALAHPLGAIYNKHHGLLNAILLPYVMIANYDVLEKKSKKICNSLNFHLSRNTFFETLLHWVVDFRKELKIPHTLKEIAIDDTNSEKIGKLATEDPSAGGNPKKLTAKEYSQIFKNAVNGEF